MREGSLRWLRVNEKVDSCIFSACNDSKFSHVANEMFKCL